MKIEKITGIILLVFALSVGSCQNTPTHRFSLSSEKNPVTPGPVFMDLPEKLLGEDAFIITDVETKEKLPGQRFGESQVVFINPILIPTQTQKSYTLTPTSAKGGKGRVSLTQTEEAIHLEVQGKPILTYKISVQHPPEGKPEYYQRSGFIHPMYSPKGQVLTNDFPEDHMHHHGIFFAWVNTTFKGEKIDFWNQQNRTGTVSHVEVIDTLSGPVYAQFTCRLQQEVLTGDNPLPALDEIWQVTAYNVSDNFLVDFSSTFTASGEDTLHINEYHYGGFAYRAPDAWFDKSYDANEDSAQNYLGPGKGGFLTSEGKTRIDGNHSRPEWVDAHGRVDEQQVGICIFDHPDNFRFPQPVRLHPSMPYFCFSPMVLGPFDLGREDIYVSRYRILTHQGNPDTALLNHYWDTYSSPPVISWEPLKP